MGREAGWTLVTEMMRATQNGQMLLFLMSAPTLVCSSPCRTGIEQAIFLFIFPGSTQNENNEKPVRTLNKTTETKQYNTVSLT